MLNYLVSVIVFVVLISGCAAPGKMVSVEKVKGDNVICILFKESRFKDRIVDNLTKSLSGKGYKVITDRREKAKYYKSSDYGAVVYMTDYWAWHTPWNAKRYYRNNNEADNIVFVITSGDPKVTIQKPFDAVTSASNTDSLERVTREITGRLDNILRK